MKKDLKLFDFVELVDRSFIADGFLPSDYFAELEDACMDFGHDVEIKAFPLIEQLYDVLMDALEKARQPWTS